MERRYSWAAFRGGAVTALCTTAFGDLWCANARGIIRCAVWLAGTSLLLYRTWSQRLVAHTFNARLSSCSMLFRGASASPRMRVLV